MTRVYRSPSWIAGEVAFQRSGMPVILPFPTLGSSASTAGATVTSSTPRAIRIVVNLLKITPSYQVTSALLRRSLLLVAYLPSCLLYSALFTAAHPPRFVRSRYNAPARRSRLAKYVSCSRAPDSRKARSRAPSSPVGGRDGLSRSASG